MGAEDPMIRVNSSVVLCRRSSKKLVNIHARPYYLVRGMPKLSLSSAVGKPFGKFKMILDKEKNIFNLETVYDIPDAKPVEAQMGLATVTRDNRNILDTSTSQKLSTEEIEEKKRIGILGAEMVDLIVENSSTFAEKSEYSQQKYIRKKMEKYDDRVTLLRPSLRLVSEIMFEDNPLAIMNLRLDTITLLLTMCGVSSGGKYLIMEHGTNALITGGALERMGGSGTLLKATFRFKKSELAVLDKLDLTAAEKAPLVGLPLEDFGCLQPGWEDPSEGDNKFRQKGRAAIKEGSFDAVIVAIKDHPIELLKTFLPLLSLSNWISLLLKKHPLLACLWKILGVCSQGGKTLLKETTSSQKGRAAIKEGSFDAVIVAIKDHPIELLKTFLPLLSLSKPFAVFSPYREVLSECHSILRATGSFVHLKLTENWFREYQVLPGRTHPLVNMSGNGGFLLTGMKVESPNGENCFPSAKRTIPAHLPQAVSQSEPMEAAVVEESSEPISSTE